jgi:hypothetical protein
MNLKGAYRGTPQPDLETQSVFFNWSAGGISPADDSFYCIHPWTWTSAPIVNTYGTPIFAKSRLAGRIRHVSIAVTNASTGSTEPIGLEIHIFPKKENAGSSPTSQVTIKKIGEFQMTSRTSVASQTQPSYFSCDIPVEVGSVFLLIIRIPTMTTNPTNFLVSGVVVIEGVSKKQFPEFKEGMGFKNIDINFGVTGNNSPANLTRYYWPLPQLAGAGTGALVTSGYTYHASPIDGYIIGATYAQLTSSISSSKERMRLGVEKKYNDNINLYTITNHHQTLIDRPTLNTNTFVKYYDCMIPIRKGEQFTPFLETPAWATTPVGLRPYIVLHLRGR